MLDVDQLIDLEVIARETLDRLREEAGAEEADPDAVKVDVAIGRLSRLDSMQMEEVRKDAVRRRNEHIHQLQQALRKMDEGSYGQCEGCGEWIAFERLKERPESTLCGTCAR
ncbi:MAG: TraR/DksA family transcriptional regulator [Akkermansiaceae bacterium]|nr:TraR/DksA family transcriptional regulator [Akkermansiaceae bacterium]